MSSLATLALQDSNKSLLPSLSIDSEVLDNIQVEFMKIVHIDHLKIHSFQKERAISGVRALSEKVII